MDSEEALEASETPEDAEDSGATPPRARRSPPRTPQILDLDFNAGDPPLAELCQKLKLEAGSDTDRYTAIAWWLKHKLQVEEITADHVHTGYRFMKWNTPADAGAPLRALKGRSYGYMKSGPKSGTFVLTHVGDNHVNDLIRAAGLVM